MNVRVRGIYATALTRLLLDTGHEVVGASPPIRRRFDAEFPDDDHDVAIATTIDTGENYGFGIRKNESDLESALNDGLAAVKDNGTYDDLKVKWFASGDN